MGGAASKQVSRKVATSAVKTSAASATKSASAVGAARMQVQTQTAEQAQSAQQRAQTAARIIQTSLTRQDLVTTSDGAPSAADVAFRNPNAAKDESPAIMEMNDELLNEMKRFQDFGKVEYLQQDLSAFESTASSYRPRSSDPIALPSDRTSNASSGVVIEHMPGRITNREMRELLRLHYEDPVAWTHEALAQKYGIDTVTVHNLLQFVGPPNVLKPLGPSEHPLGIWFDSPAAAARLTSSQAAAAAAATIEATPSGKADTVA
ncbi:hypothetical protein P43SY_004925 [Pythium insidiosum]|uniref:Uncharacterized protein n=1 Tax=Pythium insidiosum TaxID=114742 RepID=A0AAD5LQN5_PYTIN|nr:hypothetical protein P43SY_004925 [Pythium insidiosum]